MALEPFMPVLLAAMVLSVVAMVWAVGEQLTLVSGVAVAMLFVVVAISAMVFNRPFWQKTASDDGNLLVQAARGNAWLMVLTYSWGAIAMLAIYSLTSIWWWHSWQYGLMMAVLALLLIGFVALLGSERWALFRNAPMLDVTAWLSLAQAAAAGAGLTYLTTSGKLLQQRSDWPANHIFVAGGAAIIVVSLIAVYTHWRLRKIRAAT